MTVFNTGSMARTFNYLAGDVGTVPMATGHYVENIGNGPMRYLALFSHPSFRKSRFSNGWQNCRHSW